MMLSPVLGQERGNDTWHEQAGLACTNWVASGECQLGTRHGALEPLGPDARVAQTSQHVQKRLAIALVSGQLAIALWLEQCRELRQPRLRNLRVTMMNAVEGNIE